MKQDTIFTLETRSDGIDFVALWNGIRIHEDSSGQGKIVQLRLNPYVIEGDNSVAVLLTMHPARTPSFRLRILEATWGQPDTERELLRYDWSPEQSPPSGETPAWTANAPITEAFGRWAWQDADAGSLTGADRRSLLELIRSLHTAVDRRDIAEITRLFATKNREMARALDLAEDEIVEDMRVLLAGFWNAPQSRLDPFDLQKLRPVSQAGGRLVAVSQTGDAALRGTSETVELRIPVMAGRVKGVWTIMR